MNTLPDRERRDDGGLATGNDTDATLQKAREPAQLLRVSDLHVSFVHEQGDVTVVKGLSFEVGPGEVVGLVGESGSGKTIACKAILSLLPKGAYVNRGEILLNGRDVVRLSGKEQAATRGKLVALIPQDPLSSLNPVLKIGDQITETIRFHRGLDEKTAVDLAIGLLTSVQIKDPGLVMHQYPHELSGGMRQRVASIIALSAGPSLLVADEPTTSLDVTIQYEFIQMLKEVQKRLQFGMVFVTHDLALISTLADRLCVIRKGVVVESGTAERVFSDPQDEYTKNLLRAVPRIDAATPSEAGIESSLINEFNPIASEKT